MARKRRLGKREPNGRLQRNHEPANAAPFAERMRRYGLSEADARDQKSSTVIGRLYLQRLAAERKGVPNPEDYGISEEQYAAGARLALDSSDYARCLQSPRGMGIAETLTGSGDEEAHVRYVRTIVEAYTSARDVLKALQERDGLRGATIFDAVRFIVEQDLELPHFYPGLRIGLTELAAHYAKRAYGNERKAA